MSEHYADLGAVAVLDANRMKVGDHLEFNDQVCIVDRIEDGKVFLKILQGRDLWEYKIRRFWTENKIPLICTGALGLIIILLSYFHVERLFSL